jgi:hypothetical protein
MQHIRNWLKLFVLIIHMDMDNRIRFVTFLVMNGG